jgi:sulfonate transport system ATP-binding protein
MYSTALLRLQATDPGFPPTESASSPQVAAGGGARPTHTAPVATGAAVSIRGLSKVFGTKTVLANLDLDIPAGQFVAIVGRSGCGKSTLLRLLMGLETPTSGTITVGDGAGQSRIVFQEPRLLPWANVEENVAVGLGAGRASPERRAKVRETLAEVGLKDRAREWPSVLSGGQKQRVALARALVSHPTFLALDEPLGALDALTRITMQGLLERVWFTQGMTALLVTHDVAEAVALADRVIVLDEGRVSLDFPVNLPRPRERGSADLAHLEGRLLDAIFGVADVVY